LEISIGSFAQQNSQPSTKTVIKLDNPTFSGIPGPSKPYISGWVDCGKSRFPGESAPDLQPGWFLVDLEPKTGTSYLGMVARDNDTWESVTQMLRKPLNPGDCYTFSLYLAASENYSSPARTTGIAVEEAIAMGNPIDSIEHTTPIVLRIWGGKDQCDLTQLLAETDEIKNRDWKKFDFRFEPKEELNFLMLEAFYKSPSPFPMNGHILVDNLSDLVGVPCNMPAPIVDIVKPSKAASTKESKYGVKANLQNVYSKEDILMSLNDKVFTDFEFDVSTGDLMASLPLRNGVNKLQIKASNSEGEDIAFTTVKRIKEKEVVAAVTPPTPNPPKVIENTEEENVLEGVNRSELKKDLKLEIKNISFQADSTNIEQIYEATLNKIAKFLIANNDVVIEVGGHTNDRCADIVCDELSEKRAKAVMEFLIQNGVNANQLRSKGYGRTQPVASNNSSYGRRRNQRVEIKILDINS